ncbi:MAG: AgmX/PglI C-terminal domain-containing protein [Myxococcota bacterium]
MALQDSVPACGDDAVLAHRIVVDPDGAVAGVAGAEGCMADALAALSLPPADDGSYSVVDLAWKPEPRPEPAPRGGGGGGRRGSPPSVSGPMDRGVIQKVVQRNAGQFRYCYEKQLQDHPTLQGSMRVRFVIGTDGTVTSASLQANDLGSEMGSCVTSRFQRMVFPQTSSSVTVDWPLVFRPK